MNRVPDAVNLLQDLTHALHTLANIEQGANHRNKMLDQIVGAQFKLVVKRSKDALKTPHLAPPVRAVHTAILKVSKDVRKAPRTLVESFMKACFYLLNGSEDGMETVHEMIDIGRRIEEAQE